MDELFRMKIVSKRQLTVPQRLMDILGLSQGDELQLLVSNGRIVNFKPFRVRPESEVSEDATSAMDQAQEAFAKGEFEVTDLENLIGSQPSSHPAPLQESEPRGMEFRVGRPSRKGRGWKWWYPQSAPGYAAYLDPYSPMEDPSSRPFAGHPCVRISPRNFRRDDDKVYDSVGEALSGAGLDVADVEIEVHQGVVKLSGTVPERRQRLAAEDLASAVLGVRDVENNIRVRISPPGAGTPLGQGSFAAAWDPLRQGQQEAEAASEEY